MKLSELSLTTLDWRRGILSGDPIPRMAHH
jgi:hypothetical protein